MASKQKGGDSPASSSKLPVSQTKSQGAAEVDLRVFISQALAQQKEDIKREMKEIKCEIKGEIQETKEQLKNSIQENQDSAKKDLLLVVEGLTQAILQTNRKIDQIDQEAKETREVVDQGFCEVDAKTQRIENEVTMLQFRHMEFAIRLRGLRENTRENLRQKVSEALHTIAKVSAEVIASKIDKIYRVNSWIARQRNLPRDVVVYFTEREIRNIILQASFLTTVQVDGIEIGVFKELPPKMLKDRKEFGFLVKELKNRNIQFRWDAPIGIILRYQEKRYRLNTLQKAREFYEELMRESSGPLGMSSLSENMDIFEQPKITCQAGQSEKEVLEVQGAEGGFLDEPLLDFTSGSKITIPKTTREVALELEALCERPVTRAVTRQRQEQQAQLEWQMPQREKGARKSRISEAVGSAELETHEIEKGLQQMRLTLQGAPKDG